MHAHRSPELGSLPLMAAALLLCPLSESEWYARKEERIEGRIRTKNLKLLVNGGLVYVIDESSNENRFLALGVLHLSRR